MRLFLAISLFAIMFTVGCREEDDKDQEPDFSVLGLEEVLIGEEVVYFEANGIKLNAAGNEDVFLDGTNSMGNELLFEYKCFVYSNEIPIVEVKSKYADTSIVIKKEFISGNKAYAITVSRPNHKEQVTYQIVFMKVDPINS